MIPYSQAVKYCRICLEGCEFRHRLGELAAWLKDKGYEDSLANEQLERVCTLDRETLLANTYRVTTLGGGIESH